MSEQENRDDDRVQRQDLDAFFEKVHRGAEERREYATAFTRKQSSPPTIEELFHEYRNQSQQISQLDSSIGRLRWSLMVSNLLVFALVLGMVSYVAYLYRHPEVGVRSTGPIASEPSDQAAVNQQVPTIASEAISRVILESEAQFKIRSDVDRKYQLIVRELYTRLQSFRRPVGTVEERNAAMDDYIRAISDLTQVAEKAAIDNPSQEIMLAISNLALVGRELRTVSRFDDLSPETRNKVDQILVVLRAPDVRSATSQAMTDR